MGDVTTTYFHDGAKIIDELRGKTRIQYLYDAEEVIGFKAQSFYYYFVKDTQSNVRAILQVKLVGINSFELKEVARYDYDAWGNAMVTAVGDEKIDGISVAEFNPIRWKSQYYDTESGLYYINGRYYSPMTKQYLSGANVESTMLNATTIYSLCLYSFALTNPVNMGYNGYTSETNRPLVYDPPELNAWEKFWQSTLGKIRAGVLALAAIVLSAVVGQVETVLATTGLTVGSLTIFAAIAGYQSSLRGKGFWRGFEQYICGEWAQEVAITALLVIVSIGISAIAAGTAKSGSTQAPANSSAQSSNIKADLGNKLDYAFGQATGSQHNIERSIANANQLSKIGIHNNEIGRQIVQDHFIETFNTYSSIIMENTGRTTINTLLAGPGGFRGVQSIWESNKLITFYFFGG